MWISKKNLEKKMRDQRLELWRGESESRQEERLEKLEKQVKKLKKIVREGY